MMDITQANGFAKDTEPDLDGAVTDMSWRDAPKSTVSRDIVDFSVRFAWNDETGHSENGRFIPDAEQPYPQGIWLLTLKKTQSAAEMEMRCDTAGLRVAGVVPAAVLTALQHLVETHGIARLNGHSKRDTALGELLDLRIDYASGESITAHAEGGSATLPEKHWNPLWFLDFFRTYALDNGLWLQHDVP
ncbi:MAG: hypothetical protein K6F46_07520 [Desulfovibrio sp.]|nr:hypothetical protein [Desulfovibrio sp.]